MKIGKYLVDDDWHRTCFNLKIYDKLLLKSYEKKLLFDQDGITYTCAIWAHETYIMNSISKTSEFYLWFSCESMKETYILIYGDELIFPSDKEAMYRADSFLNNLNKFAAFL